MTKMHVKIHMKPKKPPRVHRDIPPSYDQALMMPDAAAVAHAVAVVVEANTAAPSTHSRSRHHSHSSQHRRTSISEQEEELEYSQNDDDFEPYEEEERRHSLRLHGGKMQNMVATLSSSKHLRSTHSLDGDVNEGESEGSEPTPRQKTSEGRHPLVRHRHSRRRQRRKGPALDDGSAGDDAGDDEGDAAKNQADASQGHEKLRRTGPPTIYYDEQTYALVSRLRAINKQLTAEVEQHKKLIQRLQEEKKQQQHVIQTLQSDLQMHKQTIKAFQTGTYQRVALTEEHRPPRLAPPAMTPPVIAVPDTPVSAADAPDKNKNSSSPPSSPSARPPPLPRVTATSPRSETNSSRRSKPRLSIHLEGEEDDANQRLASPSSASVTSSLQQQREQQQLSPRRFAPYKPAHRSLSLTDSSGPACSRMGATSPVSSVLEKKMETRAMRHAHQLTNYSHELARLERQLEHAHRLIQEKDNALRIQKIRTMYAPSSPAGGGGHGRSNDPNGVLHMARRLALISDDLWNDLVPIHLANDLHAHGLAESHVGNAFTQLMTHELVSFHDQALDGSTQEWLREVRRCGTQMLHLHDSFLQMGKIFQHLAACTHLYQLSEVFARELQRVLHAEQAIVFIVDAAEEEFWCRMPRADGKECVTVRSKLMPLPPSVANNASVSSPTPPMSSKPGESLLAGGLPCGLASYVHHTRKPLLLAAGQMTKHPCYSSANDTTDRLVTVKSASTLLVPLLHRSSLIGVIQLSGKTTSIQALGLSIAVEKCDAFTLEDQWMLTILSHFAGGIFPKVAYFTEVESNKVNEETLIQLAPEIFTCLRFEELGKVVIENAKQILDADRCSLFVADPLERTLHNWQSDISGAGVEVFDDAKRMGMTIPFGHGIVGLVAETLQTVNIVDAYEDPRFNSSWDQKTNYRTKSILAVPIVTNTGKKLVANANKGARDSDSSPRKPPTDRSNSTASAQTLLGVVQVINKSGGAPFRTKDEFLLQTISKLIALAIENSHLFQKNQELCANIGKLIANADLVEAILSLGASAEDIIGVECAALYICDLQNQELVTFHRKRRHKTVIKEHMYRNSLLEDTIQSQQLIIVNDVAAAPHFNAYVDSIGGVVARNVCIVPLMVDDAEDPSGQKLIGLLHLVNTKGRKLTFERHDLFLSIVSSQCCSVLASILEKQAMLRQKEETNQLLDTSMSFFKEMSPVGVINAVYNACTSIFSVEKAHLFLWDTDRRHMWTSKLSPNADSNSSFSMAPLGRDAGASGASLGSHLGAHVTGAGPFQPRRISVLTDQNMRVPTTEGLLEQVLVKGCILVIKQWIDETDPTTRVDAEQDTLALATTGNTTGFSGTIERLSGMRSLKRAGTGIMSAASEYGRHTMKASLSDHRAGFVKHSVIACPVWDNYGLEIVGVLVLLFPKGRAYEQTELANLPILSRQISGALNVCTDLSLLTARCRKMQDMLEVSLRKSTSAMSFTLTSRGILHSFSQPLNLLTHGFSAPSMTASLNATSALNMSISKVPLDESGNRWVFQLTGSTINDMLSDNYIKWLGKDLHPQRAVERLKMDLQTVYIRKEPAHGVVDFTQPDRTDGKATTTPATPFEDPSSHIKFSLPHAVQLQIRLMLWEFLDVDWRISVKRACEMFDSVDRERSRKVSRKNLEQVLTTNGRNIHLDQMQWDLLHSQFADPETDLIDVKDMFTALTPHMKPIQKFSYEILPVLDAISQSIINVHVILTAITL
ncbi:TPA: hypothetical protein N0F65_006688 [Lagenidium giganteum]|uniref:EF-hand domain-containing protein n=1 Tax=Lagenidium giganteum TaxID=4803 RepID=A0AAV2ZBI1_9STRA|nr:TPA: hypothetical protein N0F65_006688 [Lagenidium giganteum]